MAHRILRTPEDVDNLVKLLCELKLPVTVSWVKGADRSQEQNAVQWMWAAEVSRQLQDRAPEDVQAEWKLTIGIPILRADDPIFREHYDATIRKLPHERKVQAMKLGYPVTSLMKVRQMVRFLDEVERECRTMGLQLTPPDPDLAKYNARYRAKEESR